MELTEEGLEHVYDICDIVFQYVAMLQKAGPSEASYAENAKVSGRSSPCQSEHSRIGCRHRLSLLSRYTVRTQTDEAAAHRSELVTQLAQSEHTG